MAINYLTDIYYDTDWFWFKNSLLYVIEYNTTLSAAYTLLRFECESWLWIILSTSLTGIVNFLINSYIWGVLQSSADPIKFNDYFY